MKITRSVFFRSITIRNKELIPSVGPLLVLANHPSTFMDPIVIATILDRKVFFLAKGELFKNSFTKWLLPKLNMIPVYRKQDDPSQMNKNEDTFKKCFEHLEKGGAILMFPEGISITERKLKPIKTGAARIVLGAEARNNFELGVQIINIGLNYENPHKFNRHLFININKPLQVKEYKEIYEKDHFKAAELLSEEIRKELEKIVIAIEDKKTDDLVNNIETIYKYTLSKNLGINKEDKAQDFFITKSIVETVNYFKVIQPARVEAMQKRVKEYFSHLNHIGLSDKDLAINKKNRSGIGNSFKALCILLFGFPIWLFGTVNNFFPFEIPGWIAKKISKSIEYRGAIGMVGGMFTFLIFYTLQIILVWKLSQHQLITLVYGLSLPLTGLFAYWYWYKVNKIRTRWLLMILFYKKSVFISNLISEREQIISEFDKAKDEYLLTHGSA